MTRRIIRTLALAALGAAGAVGGPNAQEAALYSVRSPSLAVANQLAAEAIRQCRADGHRVAVAVVDRGGHLLTLQRDELARPHALELAQRKAYTAAMVGYDTARLAENIRNGTTPAAITQTTGFTGLIGGLPIRAGEEVVGGIGVSGAPGGPLDEACARAALTALGARLAAN